ncbi:uncharacterized protein LOC116337177 [Contarinia nasturtii]|uniref:uncharacterized protein LOC116337177 n=1 Tax=Contarinia nasturtii TaxID=265458 RepID=UPI0012D40872|nr:uncharacterized protein LOC116337177 [Contarinia nasturtii]XP_031617420.1 uncharacterized protein LOC116337177 [Contarinia nasturtii]
MIIILAIFLCLGTLFGDCAPPPEIVNPDDISYNGDPIQFWCVYDQNQVQFLDARSNDMVSKLELIGCLDNGKGLSLYFPGIQTTVASGDDFENAKGWFEASDTNICYVTYAYLGQSSENSTDSLMKKMADTRRIEYAARETRDFVVMLKKNCFKNGSLQTLLKLTNMAVIGHHFGAHVGSVASKYLTLTYEDMDINLTGLDPVDASAYLNKGLIFTWSDRVYSQGIFTTEPDRNNIGFNGVYIKNECSTDIKAEDLIIAINTATCQKNIIATAKSSGTGTIKLHRGAPVALASNEVQIGPYNLSNRRQGIFHRIFTLSVTCSAYETLRQALHSHVSLQYKVDPVIFSCIHSSNQGAFLQARSDDLGSKLELISCLNNGKGLSIYFPSITSTVTAEGPDFRKAKGWFDASDTNICYISYAYSGQSSKGSTSALQKSASVKKSSSFKKMTSVLKRLPSTKSSASSSSSFSSPSSSSTETANTRRVEFVATEAEIFITKIKDECVQNGVDGSFKSLRQLTVVGHNLGANIASLICKYFFFKNIETGERVNMLIALDPSNEEKIAIENRYAMYTQFISTTKHRKLNIQPYYHNSPEHHYVHIKNECTTKIKSMDLIADIHTATSRKQIVAIATHNGTGSINRQISVPKSNEVLVGVYSEFHERNSDKVFTLSINCKKLTNLTQAMEH